MADLQQIKLVIGIDHIAIAVPDLQSSIDWYTRTLGFELVEERITRGVCTSMVSAVIRAGSVTMVLVQGIEDDSQIARYLKNCGPGVQHIGLQVSSMRSAVEALANEPQRMDTEVIKGAGIEQVFLRRDGNTGVRVELIEKNGGTFSDDTVERLFKVFEEKGLF